jgi:hypothetical protein
MIITKGLEQKEANYFSNTKYSIKDKKIMDFIKINIYLIFCYLMKKIIFQIVKIINIVKNSYQTK